jgi:hypothetical protein
MSPVTHRADEDLTSALQTKVQAKLRDFLITHKKSPKKLDYHGDLR